MNSSYIIRRKIKNSRTCEICNVNVQKTSMQKHLRSKKHLENEMIIPRTY